MATFVDLEQKTPTFSDLQPTLLDSPTWLDVGELKITLTPTFEDMNPDDAGVARLNRMSLVRPPVPHGVYAAYTNNLLEQHRAEWVEQLLQRFDAEVARLSDELNQMVRHLFQFGRWMAVVGARVALVGGLLLGAMAAPQGKTQAANIFVNDPTTTVAVDGNCSLPEAIQNANLPGGGDVTGGDCVAGDAGPDDVYLQNNVTESALYNVPAYGSNTGLPVVTSDVTIHGNGNYISGDNLYRVLAVAGAGILTLDNVTVRNGFAYVGGGIFNNGGTVNLYNDCRVIDNYASRGGGIFNTNNGTFNVDNSVVDDNVATYRGGGVYNELGGTVNIYNSSVNDNASIGAGGGIQNDAGGTVNIDQSSVDYNFSIAGGGIATWGGTVNIDNSSVSDNSSVFGSGGIDNVFGTVNIYNNSSVDRNFTFYYGGGIENTWGGTVDIDNSTVNSNTAEWGGGGISNDGSSTVTINNSSVNGNTVSHGLHRTYGGGIANSGTVTINNSSVNGNYAYSYWDNTYGGGIFNWGAGSTVNVNNSSVDNNRVYSYMDDARGGGIYNGDGTINIYNNSSVNSNYAYDNGGGIGNCFGGTVDIDNSTVNGNTANRRGGGIFNYVGTVNIDNSVLTANNAIVGGGIENLASSVLTINNSLVNGNVANNIGGGLSNIVSTVSANGITLSNNIANNAGGGIYNFDGDATIDNSLILYNRAGNGGGIYDDTVFDGAFTVVNSCIVGNSDTSVFNAGGTTTQATDDWWGAVEGPGPIGPSVLGDTVSANVNYTPWLTAPLLGCPVLTLPAQAAPMPVADGSPAEFTVFDPAISKIGVLMPGEVGVTGEQLEWMVTVSNTGNAPGFNVTVTDALHDGLRIDGVDAPGATVTIVGQTVTVTYARLDPGQTVHFSIFTTVIDGVTVENMACVEDPTELDGQECATALLVTALPSTGEIPEWDSE